MRHVYFGIGLIIFSSARVGLGVYLEIPDLTLVLLLIYSAIIGRVEGGILALIVGLIHDIIIGRAIGVHGVSYMVVVYFIGYLVSLKIFTYSASNLFVMLVIGSGLFELIYWVLIELVFAINIPLAEVFHGQRVLLIFIQAGLGILFFPLIQRYLKKSGYLFNY